MRIATLHLKYGISELLVELLDLEIITTFKTIVPTKTKNRIKTPNRQVKHNFQNQSYKTLLIVHCAIDIFL